MTIRDLAAHLGLSKSTVAYALRDAPSVNAKTREFVQKRARELGYSPNPVASAFLQHVRSQGSQRYQANLAFLFSAQREPDSAQSQLGPRFAYQRSLYEGAETRAKELGYVMDKINIKEYDAARLGQILRARGVLGIIIGPLPRPIGHVMLDWSKFSTITYGYSMTRPAVHRVVHNHLHGMRTAFRMLKREGFSRVGLVLSDESDLRSNGLWSCGYLGIQETLPKARQVRPFFAPASQCTPEKIQGWLRREKPEVVVFQTTGTIPRLPEFLNKKIACTVLDRAQKDPFSGIDQQFALSGSLMVDLLAAQILNNQRGVPISPIVSMVDGAWASAPTA